MLYLDKKSSATKDYAAWASSREKDVAIKA